MRIVILCQWFPPEFAPIGTMLKELAQDLTAKGHRVTIITGYPNHPSGIVYEGYKKRLYSTENLDGIKIIRCYLYTSPNKSFFRRVANFLSFALTSFLATLFLKKQDLLFIVSPPLTNGIAAVLLKKLKNLNFVFNVQDIYPDVAISTGVIKSSLLIRMLKGFERMIYRNASGIAVISNGFKENLLTKGVCGGKVRVIPNWIDTDEIIPMSKINTFSQQHDLEDKFVILYSGTIGLVSGAEVLLDCAEQLLGYKDILFLFVGDGVVKERIMNEARDRNLPNMKFLPFQLREVLSEVQSSSDVSIVTLHEGKGKTSVPSKVLGFMAAARPVIASVDSDSDTAKLIRNAQCGICVNAEKANEITEAILELYSNREQAKAFGQKGREYLVRSFNRKSITDQYEQLFLSVCEAIHDTKNAGR